jgi:hypothetical protein
MNYNQAQKEELGLTENVTVWAVAHNRITVTYETTVVS